MATFEEFMKVAEISLKDKTSHARMNEIVRIMRQYKVLHGLTPAQAVEVLQALGPTYVKIGQLASNRSDLLPKAYCDAFEKLRDDANPMPFDVVIEQIDRAYGKSWHEVFASIDPVPLGAASIAQVHKATLLDGTTVAVKVRRPGVAESMAEDIMLMKHLLALGEFASNSHRSILLSLEGFVEEIERTTASEVNFTSELHNLMRFHDELADEEGVTSPVAYPQYSCESVLVMEFVQGTEISHTEELRQQGIDVNALARRVCQSYVTQVLDDGFFHADPHPGNVIIRDGRIVYIDLGNMGRLSARDRAGFGDIIEAVGLKDPGALKDALMRFAAKKDNAAIDHARFLADLDLLLEDYGSCDVAEIDVGQFLSDIMQLTRSCNVMLPASVTSVSRGIVTIEGTVAPYIPNQNIVAIINAHIKGKKGTREEIRDALEDLARAIYSSGRGTLDAASYSGEALKMLTRGQLKMNMEVLGSEAPLAHLSRMINRVAIAMVIAGLFVGSSLMAGTAMEPRFLGVPMLSFFGYFGSLVLSIWLIFSIWRRK